mmetsp:Transcript_25167/g.51389  ORF Transcript_25167/g.51389 Transcript_25167/m.51389 type:complete len:93 (-) Transcript_25167:134-412(-)
MMKICRLMRKAVMVKQQGMQKNRNGNSLVLRQIGGKGSVGGGDAEILLPSLYISRSCLTVANSANPAGCIARIFCIRLSFRIYAVTRSMAIR